MDKVFPAASAEWLCVITNGLRLKGDKMRMVKTVVAGLLLLLLAGGGPAMGADVAKIGVINFQRVLEASSAGKASQVEISEQGKKMEADLKLRQSELQELQKQMERERLVMSREMRDEKERDFRIRVNDFKSLEKKYKQELGELNKKLVKRLQDDVFDLVEELGRKEGFLLIVEKLEGGVIYSPKTNDVTDKIIQMYNERFAQKGAKPAAKP